MAFESLSERLNKAFKNISGQGKLTEKNMNDMLKEVRMSLLEADVNYDVVKSFVENVKEKALGQEVLDSLNPGQMVVKIVHDFVPNSVFVSVNIMVLSITVERNRQKHHFTFYKSIYDFVINQNSI